MEKHLNKKNNRRTSSRAKLPDLNKIVLDYMYINSIKSGEFEDLTGVHRSSLTTMKRAKKMYVDTLYMFSQGYGHNFFIPVMELLYTESPECRQQDPLYIELKALKEENERLKKELENRTTK